MHLPDEAVDHCWTQHVAMNIDDPRRLYREIRRVLRPGRTALVLPVYTAG